MTKEQYKERKQDWSEKTDQLKKKDEHLANEISKRLMMLGNLADMMDNCVAEILQKKYYTFVKKITKNVCIINYFRIFAITNYNNYYYEKKTLDRVLCRTFVDDRRVRSSSADAGAEQRTLDCDTYGSGSLVSMGTEHN